MYKDTGILMAPPGYHGGSYLSHHKQLGLSYDMSTGDEFQLICEKANTKSTHDRLVNRNTFIGSTKLRD